jgi:hypothetical protein
MGSRKGRDMLWLIKRLGLRLGRFTFWLIVALLATTLLATAKCVMDRGAKTQIKVAKEQAGAAVLSGSDAVETVGTQQAAEQRGDAITKENEDAIRGASGATTHVDPAVRNAGIAGLCRRASYRLDPRCLQQPAP